MLSKEDRRLHVFLQREGWPTNHGSRDPERSTPQLAARLSIHLGLEESSARLRCDRIFSPVPWH
jgi:hypothetical protein